MLKMLLGPLVATIVIELGVLLFVGERRRKVLYGSVVMNVLTNVPLNLYAVCVEFQGWSALIAGELLVVLVEALGYRMLLGDWRQAGIYSLLCNAISFLTGELLVLIILLFTSY
jgi:hypothetical protein